MANEEVTIRKGTIAVLTALVTIITAIVMTTIYVANKPSRDEVKEMIDSRVEKRISRIETQLDELIRMQRNVIVNK